MRRAPPELEGDHAAETAADDDETLDAQRVGDRENVVGISGARDRCGIRIGLLRSVAAQLDCGARAVAHRTLRAARPKSPRSNRRRARRAAATARRRLQRAAISAHRQSCCAAFARNESAHLFERARVQHVGLRRVPRAEPVRRRTRWPPNRPCDAHRCRARTSRRTSSPCAPAVPADRVARPGRRSRARSRCAPPPRRRRRSRTRSPGAEPAEASKRRPVGWPMIVTYGFSQARMRRAVISSRDWLVAECTDAITTSSSARTSSSKSSEPSGRMSTSLAQSV